MSADAKFDEFDNALNLLHKIRKGKITLADAKNDQLKFKSNLGEIKKENKKQISKERKKHTARIEILYKPRDNVIKFYDGYSSMVYEARHEKTKENGLKILTSKQMLQRLPIKPGNNSESL